jgi:hypothetical protein
MKKQFKIIAIIICCALLLQPHVIESLMYFLLAGVIPGTDFSLPPTAMLLLLFAITWLLLFRFVIAGFIHTRTKNHTTKPRQHKKHMPRRRFREV